MHNQSEANHGGLSALLREARPAPPLPPRFQAAVWRRIEQAEAPLVPSPPPWRWLQRAAELLLLPRVALASLTVLLVAGALTGLVGRTDHRKQLAQERYWSAVAPSLHP